ncbi:hypothetical protein PIROE2DRAFT_16071 [Piromyces sp. E2]|nr:hypothetical protein PIROE2DRAFT_16071 [Piromyces sp. E2]|eukprot:OUM58592.1 hypothetical protein PIROE2DRAFT_16071 [Piromyces sp. E2]
MDNNENESNNNVHLEVNSEPNLIQILSVNIKLKVGTFSDRYSILGGNSGIS